MTTQNAIGFRCDCVPEGQTAPHSSPEQCSANRQATADYLRNLNFPPILPSVRDADGRFVRFCEGAENDLPHGTPVADGVVRRYRV